MPCSYNAPFYMGFLLLLPSDLVKAGRQVLAMWSPDLHPGNLLQSPVRDPDFNIGLCDRRQHQHQASRCSFCTAQPQLSGLPAYPERPHV
jgi:hypothetical protein